MKFEESANDQLYPFHLQPTLSKRDRNEMKSAHSFMLSKDCKHRSTVEVYFLYLVSSARCDVTGADNQLMLMKHLTFCMSTPWPGIRSSGESLARIRGI